MPRRFRSLEDPATLAMFVRRIREAIYVTTPAGEILDGNPALVALFGFESLEELKRQTAHALLVDPTQRAQELEQLGHSPVREFELEIKRQDGTRCTVVDTAYSVVDPESGDVLYHGILTDITEHKRLERQLVELTFRDPLTGAYNRRYLADLASRLEARVGARWGVIVTDIDDFKRINDTQGHTRGDEVLAHFAGFLRQHVRHDDCLVRLGGDEFLLLLGSETAGVTAELAQRCQEAAALAAPVAFSLGWAVREEGETLACTIARADESLIGVRHATRRPRRRQLD